MVNCFFKCSLFFSQPSFPLFCFCFLNSQYTCIGISFTLLFVLFFTIIDVVFEELLLVCVKYEAFEHLCYISLMVTYYEKENNK